MSLHQHLLPPILNGEAAIELQIKDLAKATAYLKANSDKLSISVGSTQ
ncbi:MAG: hypothetical protein U1E98_05775 [Moraxella osloensis]